MKKSYKENIFKFLVLAGVVSTVAAAGVFSERKDKKDNALAVKMATVVTKNRLDGDEMTVTRLGLDMDRNKDTIEAFCDMEMELPYADPRYEKIFPIGTTRSVFEWKKMGRFRMVKTGNAF